MISKWADGHCDVLSKMGEEGSTEAFHSVHSPLDVTFPAMIQERVILQNFAIFVSPTIPKESRYEVALRQIDAFYQRVVGRGLALQPVTRKEDIDMLSLAQPGALLSLEGGDILGKSVQRLEYLHRLGVRQIGLTWNHGNELATGVEEPRDYGLTHWGRLVVERMKSMGIILDLSHLSEQGFWDVIGMAERPPIIASHSNSYAICPHRRNLKDEQILAMIEQGGVIGLTYVPSFINGQSKQATMYDLCRHIDHILHLGGMNQLAFGSDFDGMNHKLPDLHNLYQLQHFKRILLERYPQDWVERWAWRNALTFYQKALSK